MWETPPAVGWLLFFIAVSGLAVFIPWWSFRWVWQRRTEAQLARLISRTDAALGDRLLGVIELDSEKHGRQYGSEKLKEAAMEQVAREVSAVDEHPRPSCGSCSSCWRFSPHARPYAGQPGSDGEPETLVRPFNLQTLYIHPAGPHPGLWSFPAGKHL
ncbi:MAG: hypothetical protein ACLT8E_07495 [Akkermansia sp.]